MNNEQNTNTMTNFLQDYLEINDSVYIKGVQHKRLYMIIGIGKIDGEVYYRLKDCINGNKEIYHNEVVYNYKEHK